MTAMRNYIRKGWRQTIFNILYFGFAVVCRILPIFLLPLPLSSPPPFVVVEKKISADRFDHGASVRDDRLQAEADALLPLFDNMPSVPVRLKNEPILKTGTEAERRVAYTFCDGGEVPFIIVKQIFYQKTNRVQLVNILKHELTHAFLCRRRESAGHDERFRRKFKEVGGFGN